MSVVIHILNRYAKPSDVGREPSFWIEERSSSIRQGIWGKSRGIKTYSGIGNSMICKVDLDKYCHLERP